MHSVPAGKPIATCVLRSGNGAPILLTIPMQLNSGFTPMHTGSNFSFESITTDTAAKGRGLLFSAKIDGNRAEDLLNIYKFQR